MGLWSFLRRLWPRRTRSQPEKTSPAEPSPGELRVSQEDEDEGWEGDDELDLPDPFISAPPVQLETPDADLEQRRADARAEALAGEHRIYLSMPAGPGSLAEALNHLSADGMVEAEFIDNGESEPHILYRPLQ